MKTTLQREWARWKQEWSRQPNRDIPSSQDASSFHWLDRLRWWLLPLLLGGVTLYAWFQLSQLTKPAHTPYLPLIFDAPLRHPLQLTPPPSHAGKYLVLRSKGVEGRFVALQPGPGTRAYKGRDTVPLFGSSLSAAELFPSSCQDNVPDDDVQIFTNDGMILWLCQHPKQTERFEIRRIGWRFSLSQWRRGRTLGKSSQNHIVLGTALIPAQSLSLQLVGQRLKVTSAEPPSTPDHQRLVCFTRDQNDTTTPTCQWKPLYLEPGQRIRVFAKHHPSRAITLRWTPARQEKAAYDLRLLHTTSIGSSSRSFSLTTLKQQQYTGLFVGNAESYFRHFQPDNVTTQDLDDVVHDLVLRNALVYLDPHALQTTLARRYKQQIKLDQLSQHISLSTEHPKLRSLHRNQYLRNRIWLANRSLAQRYRLQARNLFRIRFPRQSKPGALLGLGAGGGLLRAPTRHLLRPQKRLKKQRQDPRLGTSLHTRNQGTPYLQVETNDTAQPTPLLLTQRQPLEILAGTAMPPAAYKRAFQRGTAIAWPRTALWINDILYTSHQPYAYAPTRTNQPQTTPKAGQRPTQFFFRISKRWWKREPDKQRSSKDWPIEDLAQTLGTLLTKDKLTLALQQRNPKRIRTRKHCGNQSLREKGRWKHKRTCWGTAALLATGTQVIVPCSDLLRSKIKERYCKPGQPSAKVDTYGRPVLTTTVSLDGLHGIVLRPGTANQHVLEVLPQSGHVTLNNQPIQGRTTYPLRDNDRIQLGSLILRYRIPKSTLAYARFRGEYITPHYPQRATFAHAIAGSVGGPFRNGARALREQLPPTNTPTTNKTPDSPTRRDLHLTLDMDLQRVSFAVASHHLARMDSPAFQKQFRRRYFHNPHKPHAGAVVIVNRRNGQVLTSLSFPAFDPNLPPLQKQGQAGQRTYRYLRGQITDRYGITDSLLAYNPSRLPPLPPNKKRQLLGRPDAIPHYLAALQWDREEERRGIRGDARSGWLLERALGGAQTPGSTAKIVTAIAYARYLRKQGKPVRFPTHTCGGGMMFMREHKHKKQWRPSTLRFRCHRKQGHGTLSLKQALAVSCNVYFAKLALEMAGVPDDLLRKGSVSWLRNKHGGQGRYQAMRIPRNMISDAMRQKPIHRTLFRTAAQLGFTMRYTYQRKARQYARYTDVFWEPSMTPWRTPTTDPTDSTERNKRLREQQPHGFFGLGRYFGRSAAYPAWQQWAHGTRDPRHGKPISVTRSFGSTDASIRAMAYVGFGQSLIINPLRMALVAGSVVNNGWLPAPKLWLGESLPKQAKLATFGIKRPTPKQLIHASDAAHIRAAMAAVTANGTAAKPFAALNQQCLREYGLQVVGKTGTAEHRSQRARSRLLKRVKAAGARLRLPAKRKWFRESGCYKRRFWKHYFPEENIADSLFVGAIAPTKQAGTRTSLPAGNGWRFQDLAFAVVVKNGYHPEGVVCRKQGRDLDRAEAKYLAHDILVAALQQLGACRNYRDPSQPRQLVTAPKRRKRTRRKRKRTRRKRTRRKRTRRKRKRTRRKRPRRRR
jgi:cell division protein FtsI/penicillin-binding protein 2